MLQRPTSGEPSGDVGEENEKLATQVPQPNLQATFRDEQVHHTRSPFSRMDSFKEALLTLSLARKLVCFTPRAVAKLSS